MKLARVHRKKQQKFTSKIQNKEIYITILTVMIMIIIIVIIIIK